MVTYKVFLRYHLLLKKNPTQYKHVKHIMIKYYSKTLKKTEIHEEKYHIHG